MKTYKILSCVVGLWVCLSLVDVKAEFRRWDMSETPSFEYAYVPMAEDFPNNIARKPRQMLESDCGNIVFGTWRDDNIASNNPVLKDGRLVFSGGQTAYIDNVPADILALRKLAFEFSTVSASQQVNLFHIPNTVDIRLEPSSPYDGTARVRMYVYNDSAVMKNVKTAYGVVADNWYKVECSFLDGNIEISLDGVVDQTNGTQSLDGDAAPVVYNNMFIGSKWDGSTRWFNGSIDNIEVVCSGVEVQKDVWVPTVAGFPTEKIKLSRQVVVDDVGDIVLGTWSEGSSASKEPSLEYGALVFDGGQTAYIENVPNDISDLHKISFDFKPASVNADVNLLDIPYAVQVRMEPGSGGTARLRFYVNNDADPSVMKNVKTDYTVALDQWQHVECLIADGNISISLDGVILSGDGTAALEGNVKAVVYPNTYIGSRWDGDARWFDGSIKNMDVVTTKDIAVPTESGFPTQTVTQPRIVVEDNAGDIVLGIWHEDSVLSQNPAVEDGVLVFDGGQTAYVENMPVDISTLRKIAFDFNPESMDTDVNLLDIPYSIQVRLEPGLNDTARVRFYANNDETPSVMKNVKTDYTVALGQWQHVECLIADGNISISLDDVTHSTDGTQSLNGGLCAVTYPNMFIGSRWDGLARWFDGSIKNIDITYTGVTVKNVSVPTVAGFPDIKTTQSRQVVESDAGDIIFGIWREDSLASQSPCADDGMIIFDGGQTAYIENMPADISILRKISFAFNPSAVDEDVNFFDIPYSIQVRLEPHATENTARVRFYVLNDSSVWRSAKSGYDVVAGQWYNAVCSIIDGQLEVSLNGQVDAAEGKVSLDGQVASCTYENLFIGSRWDGLARWYEGILDNIQVIDENDEFDARCDRLRGAALGIGDALENNVPEVPDVYSLTNIYGAYAGTMLRLGFWKTECNEIIRYICDNIEQARDKLTAPIHENFTGLELARIYLDLNGTNLLESTTSSAIRDVFKTCDFGPTEDIRSENHYFVFWAARYLMAQEMPTETFQIYGKTGAQLYSEDGQRLKDFIRYRAKQGWGEFDSNAYQFLSFNTLLTLFDFSDDSELVGLAEKMLNLLLADMSVDTLNGLYGGARGRVYDAMVLDSGGWNGIPPMNDMNELQYLYFDIADPNFVTGQERLLRLQHMNYWDRSNESLFSSFRPMQIVKDIMSGRDTQYVNRERKHLHNMADPLPVTPLSGSIRKYTWYEPDKYTLGSIQLQDAYPVGLEEGIYAKHQQLEWCFGASDGTRTKIFTHHPGNQGAHSYWRGDLGCGCINTFQNKTAVVAVFDIAQDQTYQFIHAYLPQDEFDEIDEESGWIFARKGDVYAALYLTGGYTWTTIGEWSGVEIKSTGSKKASIFEAGLAADFGTFAAFKSEIKNNSISFDTNTMTLTYNSQSADKIKINTSGLRQVDDVNVDLNYKTYDSPYMQSQWNSGIITLEYGNDQATLNFN